MFHGFIPHIMGTRFDILLIHSDAERLNGLWYHIINELERLDKILNRFDPHSEVSGINKHALQSYIQISKELEEILQLCQYYYENTFHLFDITLKRFLQNTNSRPSTHFLCIFHYFTRFRRLCQRVCFEENQKIH